MKRGEENLAQRHETASEHKKLLTFNLSSRRLYKLHANISGHILIVTKEVGCRDASKTYRAAIKNLFCHLAQVFEETYRGYEQRTVTVRGQEGHSEGTGRTQCGDQRTVEEITRIKSDAQDR